MKPDAEGLIPPHQPNCFGCGPDNSCGLQMRMRVVDDHVHASLTFPARFEGAPGITHGGAVAAALDDLFGGVLVMLGRPAVTARLTVNYHAPVFLGRPVRLDAWAAGIEGRKLDLRATLHDADLLLAEAQAVFASVDIAHFERAGVPIPDEWRAWAALQAQP